MASRSFEIGNFDVSEAEHAYYNGARISFGHHDPYARPAVGEVVDDVARIEFDERERLHGLKVFYECHSGNITSSGPSLDFHKLIWQLSARETYWHYRAKDTPEFVEKMAPNIYDQTKQGVYSGRTLDDTTPGLGWGNGGGVSNEVEKFIDPTVLANVPLEFEPGDAIYVHARVSKDTDSVPEELIARSTVTAYTSPV